MKLTTHLQVMSRSRKELRGLSPRANYADRAKNRLSEKLVQTFGDKGYRVVSATDPYGFVLGFF
jgi:hypothetical protein